MEEKIRPELNSTAETMLQSFYARAMYAQSKKPKFYDAKAIEIVSKLDYDFSAAKKDNTMSGGVIARTLVLDHMVKEFIEENPACIIVNIASGLDTRFYRMSHQKLLWFNIDLPEVIALRNQLFPPAKGVINIGCSVLDEAWTKQIPKDKKTLFLIEGLSMYFTAEQNQRMLEIIHSNFDHALVFMECLAKKWVHKEGVEKSIAKTGAKFCFGADSFEDIQEIAPGFSKVKDETLITGMLQLYPYLKPFAGLSMLKKAVQKILVFEKTEENKQ
jgi:O-methyltransferase involved in polyketide biosynthesis